MNFRYIFLLLLISQNLYSGTVYIVHYAAGYTDAMLFNPNHHGGGLFFLALRHAINKCGHQCIMFPDNCQEIDSNAWFIALESPTKPQILNVLAQYPKDRSILLMWEPPSVLPNNYNPALHIPFDKVFTLFHEMVDNKTYFPLYYPQSFLYMIKDIVPFNQKKLCTMIVGEHTSIHPNELYTHRRSIISFFERMHPEEFDFYGNYWTNYNHPCYKGTVPDKIPYLRHYKFAICYENMTSKTYLTEKIFDILHAGCVPIYWGAQDITQLIPQKAYILREDFGSDEELYHYLETMPESEYQKYLAASIEFFYSTAAAKFSISWFVDSMIKALFE